MNSGEFLAGFITSQQTVLQRTLNVLASEEQLTEGEMRRMREDVDLIDASVRRHHRDIHQVRLRPKLTLFERLLDLTLTELTRRERHRGRPVPESEAMRARRLRRDADLDAYASDGQGEVPLESWSLVNPAPQPAPRDAEDLRQILTDRREGRERNTWWSPQRTNEQSGNEQSRNEQSRNEQSRNDVQQEERHERCRPTTP